MKKCLQNTDVLNKRVLLRVDYNVPIKDGKIFNELHKGDLSRKEFFDKIINVVTVLGGDLNDAL